MFGLDCFMVVLVWSGMSNISFFYENELVWIWFGFEPGLILTLIRSSLRGHTSVHSLLPPFLILF